MLTKFLAVGFLYVCLLWLGAFIFRGPVGEMALVACLVCSVVVLIVRLYRRIMSQMMKAFEGQER